MSVVSYILYYRYYFYHERSKDEKNINAIQLFLDLIISSRFLTLT